MSRQGTLDAHLAPVTPRRRPRSPPAVTLGSSSDGERGLSTIKLERKRTKWRISDVEDDFVDHTGRHQEWLGSRASRKEKTSDDARISCDGESEPNGPPEMIVNGNAQKEITFSPGRLSRRESISNASTGRSPVTSSLAYFIPSDSEEPIVLSSQAHAPTQGALSTSPHRHSEGTEQSLRADEAVDEVLSNCTQTQSGSLDLTTTLADNHNLPGPPAANVLEDTSTQVSANRETTSAFKPRKRNLQRIESVEIVAPPGFDMTSYTSLGQAKAPAHDSRQEVTFSVSRSAPPITGSPITTPSIRQAINDLSTSQAVQPSKFSRIPDYHEPEKTIAPSQASMRVRRDGVAHEEGDSVDAELSVGTDPAMENGAFRAYEGSELDMAVQLKRGPPKEDVEPQYSSEPSPESKSRGSSQAGPSRLSASAKDKVRALAERKRALREAQEKTRRRRGSFIADDSDSSESEEISVPSQKSRPAVAVKGSRSRRRLKQEASDEETSRRRNVKSLRRETRKILDPDQDDNEAMESEAEDLVKEVELDEADRFTSATRLRKRKETTFQRALRKKNNLRLGVQEFTTESESDSRSADDTPIVISDDSWIEDVGEEFDDSLMPQQFSNDSTQTPEFVFKVVFQYMLLLVIAGPACLPLNSANEQYFIPRLNYMRRKLDGLRTSVVQSQIWRREFVKAMQTFPHLHANYMDELYDGCDACHMSGRMSRFEAILDGHRYDVATFEDLSEDDASRGSDGESLVSQDDLPRQFKLGRMCHARTKVFHQFCHWEYDLHLQIKLIYDDMRLAKGGNVSNPESESDSDLSEEERRVRRRLRREARRRREQRVRLLKAKRLPSDTGDLNEVLEWFEDEDYVSKLFTAQEHLIDSAHALEGMRASRDDE